MHCVVPQNLPSHILQSFAKHHLKWFKVYSRASQSSILLSQAKLGFCFLQGSWGFQGLNQVPYAHIHCQAPTCQVSRLTWSSCTVKNPNCFTSNYRGKMVIWQSKVKIFGQHIILKPQSSFDQVLIMFSKHGSKIIKMQKFLFLDSWKVNCNLTKA